MLIDTTLRDGEQAPGVCLRVEDRIAIARGLVEFGVTELEIRSPVLDPRGQEETRTLMQAVPEAQWLLWCRARQEDLEIAQKLGAQRAHVAFPMSDVQLSSIGWSWEAAQSFLQEFIAEAKRHFSFVSAGAQDASRTSIERLSTFCQQMVDKGVSRLRVADTLGLLSPLEVQHLFTNLRSACPGLDLEFHGHNDLGMATANALTALQSGASHVSATVLGIGERCGNAALEQVALALKLRGHPEADKFHLESVQRLCKQVSRAMERPIPASQPIVGSDSNRHQSGIHVQGLLRDPRTYQPYAPELVGKPGPEIVLGATTGRDALRHLLRQQGVTVEDSLLLPLLARVKERIHQQGHNLAPEELVQEYQLLFVGS
ncbi:MAG TPA: hypothetical protein VLM37_03705 [Fibrobacteraceae bacterium]|nr:hypothetical protein [Fibrobacteraceae bacterium]